MTKTTIQIETTTRDRAKSAKRGGENYDALINRALDALGEKVTA